MKKPNHLNDWLTHPSSAEFFGRAFEARAAALALVIRGYVHGDIAAEARRLNLSRAAMHKHVTRAKGFALSLKS